MSHKPPIRYSLFVVLSELIQEQRATLAYFFDQIDVREIQRVLDAAKETTGFLVFSGVGKSGIVAEKIVTTLISTGTKAIYLPPSNVLHGDLGIVSGGDLVLLLSKSGETEELLQLLPFFKRKGAKTVAVVSTPQSRLATHADLTVHLPVERELCQFDLVPTTSAVVQLLFGDLLAMALMRTKGFSLDEYGANHPSGTIGKRITLKVGDLMLRGEDLPLCSSAVKLQEVLPELSGKRCGCLLITGPSGQFQGIFTDGDLRRSLQSMGPSVLEETLGRLMTRSAAAVGPNLLAWEALQQMQRDPKKWIMVLPVIEQGRVVGLIRMHDIIHAGVV
jgi:arabinose-5-phosphate isomerase